MKKTKRPGIVVSVELEKEFCEGYLAGENAYELGRRFGCCHTTIYKYLDKYGIKRRERKFSFSKEQLEYICNEYIGGKSAREIGEIYGVQHHIIERILKECGIAFKPKTECNRKYLINHNAFSGEITEEMAYWIGFLMADGNIYYPHGRSKMSPNVRLQLQKGDIGHIEKLRSFLGSTNPIKFRKRAGTVFFSLSSRKMVEDLERYNVVPRKSTRECAPDILLNNRHFWRGMVDGDGTLGILKYYNTPSGKKYRSPFPFLALCGSSDITNQFKNFVLNFIQTKTKVYGYTTQKLHVYRTAGLNAKIITRVLYDNCSVFLDRKFVIAAEILKLYPNDKKIRW